LCYDGFMGTPDPLSILRHPIQLALTKGMENPSLLANLHASIRHLIVQLLNTQVEGERRDLLMRLAECLDHPDLQEGIKRGARLLNIPLEVPAVKPVPKSSATQSVPLSSAAKPPQSTPLKLDTALQFLPGIGPRRAEHYRRLGLTVVGDLFTHFPRAYLDRRVIHPLASLPYEGEISVLGKVRRVELKRIRAKLTLLEVLLTDGAAGVKLNFWNQQFLQKMIKPDMIVLASGKLEWFKGHARITVTEWEELEEWGTQESPHYGRLVPVYPATEGLTPRLMRETVWRCRDLILSQPETLPPEMIARLGLMGKAEALWQRHFPSSDEQYRKAENRLAFDALLALELDLMERRRHYRAKGAQPLSDDQIVGEVLARFGRELTTAQQRAWQEIQSDIASETPMCRMLQGDVGSGKTIVAACALATAAARGGQAALMAPTEILAEQHWHTLHALLSPLGFAPYLLTGSSSQKERDDVAYVLAAQQGAILIGTHALLSGGVEFRRLVLTIIDEQHRFGVMQRGTLQSKGERPHLLVMTATPIPRTLAIALYGDLDLSVLDEMPPGRTPVITKLFTHRAINDAYEMVRREVASGRQAFLVYPLVEESEAEMMRELKAAKEMFKQLQSQVFPEFRLGLLTGKMRPAEKEKVMQQLKNGEVQVLVSTTVIEVGIDFPNATVMLIEHAERYGLSQLHQLRGRVGRGRHQSYCLLVCGPRISMEGRARLSAMVETSDGFEIARLDLEQRGAGELAGVRQHGMPDLALSALANHPDLLVTARQEAIRIMEEDPELVKPENRGLCKLLEQRERAIVKSAEVV